MELLKKMQIISFMQQPPLTNCENVRLKYDEEALFSLAFQEYNSLKRNKMAKNLNMNNVITRNGALYCFCENEIKNSDNDRFTTYTFTYSDPKFPIDRTEEAPICKKYYQYMTGFGYVLETSFNYLIVIFSYVVRTFFIWIAEKIRFMSLTQETRFVMLSVFYITFINYGVLYLFASWDNRHTNFKMFDNLFEGLYPDFNALWFNDVGVLVVKIMISNMYWPPLEFIMFWGLRLLYRMIDQRSIWPNDENKTHCKTLQAFEDIYSGEFFSLHYKYSYILVVVYVTFLFGAGLPILFPIAFLSLLLLYIVERLMMAYSYRAPPMFGTEANHRTLTLCLTAPVMYAAMGAWLFTNQQVFRNVISVNTGDAVFPDAHHSISCFFTEVYPGTVFVIIGCLLILMWCMRKCYKCYQKNAGRLGLKIRDEVTKQTLSNFFDWIDGRQKKGYFKEEDVCRNQLHFSRLPDSTYNKLKNDIEASKSLGSGKVGGGLKAAYSYNMLSQAKYYNKYMYIPYTIRNRKDYIVSMYKNQEIKKISVDVVRLASDLAYLPLG